MNAGGWGGFDNKTLKFKPAGIRGRVRCNLTAVIWKDKRDLYILTNKYRPPTEGNFCDEQGKAGKPAIVTDYNRHMGYDDKGYRTANSYSIIPRTWKWTIDYFCTSILNSYIILSSRGNTIEHRKFRLDLVQDLLIAGGPHSQTSP
jgi:hypothetical protein